MLISPGYLAQNKLLHEIDPIYGTRCHGRSDYIIELINQYKARTLLDYGCGKATLAAILIERRSELSGLTICSYDPAMPEYSERPQPADLVICADVLEHVEPELLDNVLDDILSLTLKVALLVIATRPAKKTLPDGRNAHLIIEQMEWWLPKFRKDWITCQITTTPNELGLLLQPR